MRIALSVWAKWVWLLWERIQCVDYVCCLWNWIDSCSSHVLDISPGTCYLSSWSFGLLDWKRRVVIHQPYCSNQEPELSLTPASLSPGPMDSTSKCSSEPYPLLYKSSTSIPYPIIIISNLECYSKLWTTLPSFALTSLYPIFQKTARVVFLI